MAKTPTASDLYHRVAFLEPQSGSDGLGGMVDGFAERFQRRAQFVHLRGGETVLAARLEGVHSQVIRVRADSQTRAVTTDWRIADQRTGVIHEVKDVTPSENRSWVEILVTSGIAG